MDPVTQNRERNPRLHGAQRARLTVFNKPFRNCFQFPTALSTYFIIIIVEASLQCCAARDEAVKTHVDFRSPPMTSSIADPMTSIMWEYETIPSKSHESFKNKIFVFV